MNDNINISIPKDGGIPNVEGSKAILVNGTHSSDGSTITVKFDLTPGGDDAIHGGSLTVVATYTKPDFHPSAGGVVEQATAAAEYCRLLVETAQDAVGNHLVAGFADAIKDEILPSGGDDREATVEKIAQVCQVIAVLLLAKHDGDKDKAKANADIRQDPDIYKMAQAAGMDELEGIYDILTETVRHAIDLADAS